MSVCIRCSIRFRAHLSDCSELMKIANKFTIDRAIVVEAAKKMESLAKYDSDDEEISSNSKNFESRVITTIFVKSEQFRTVSNDLGNVPSKTECSIQIT